MPINYQESLQCNLWRIQRNLIIPYQISPKITVILPRTSQTIILFRIRKIQIWNKTRSKDKLKKSLRNKEKIIKPKCNSCPIKCIRKYWKSPKITLNNPFKQWNPFYLHRWINRKVSPFKRKSKKWPLKMSLWTKK